MDEFLTIDTKSMKCGSFFKYQMYLSHFCENFVRTRVKKSHFSYTIYIQEMFIRHVNCSIIFTELYTLTLVTIIQTWKYSVKMNKFFLVFFIQTLDLRGSGLEWVFTIPLFIVRDDRINWFFGRSHINLHKICLTVLHLSP